MSLENLSFEARDELAAIAQQMSEDPSTRGEFLSLLKKIKPDLPVPELEVKKYAESVVSETRQELEAVKAKLREKEALEELDSRRKALLKKGLVKSESDIQEVEKVMLDEGITNHESGAKYWAWMKQSAEPTPVGYNPGLMSSNPSINQFMKNPKIAARNEALQAMKDFRGSPKPIGL